MKNKNETDIEPTINIAINDMHYVTNKAIAKTKKTRFLCLLNTRGRGRISSLRNLLRRVVLIFSCNAISPT